MTGSAAQSRLLDAAVDAFAEHGYHGTTTRDIAARAGRSPALVYVHHSSKEELLFAISLRGHRDALASLDSAFAAHDDPTTRLWWMVHDFSLWHLINAKLGRVVQYESRALSADHWTEVAALRRRFTTLMIDGISAGTDTDEFRVDDLQNTARALLSLGIDLARWFDPGRRADAEPIAVGNAELAVRMVRRSPSDRAGRRGRSSASLREDGT